MKKENNSIEQENLDAGERITTPFKPSDISLSTPPMNLGDLIDMIEAGWINFDTKYQRGENLWDATKQARLVESILLGLRLPAFYFEEVSKRQWNIIDGLQRCCAIRNFCVTNTLVLNDLEFLGEQFDGENYSQFNFETRRDIRMLPITVNLLAKGTPPDVKYILFKRLNTGGITLKPQEIRTAMFQGAATDIIERMVSSEAFLNATRRKIPTKRQEDRDFVSRYIAFYLQDYHEYQPKLEQFINKAMVMLTKGVGHSLIERMESDFTRAMQAALSIFGDYAFRRRRDLSVSAIPPLNKAYFEVVAVIFAKLSDAQLSRMVERRNLLNRHVCSLMQDEFFWKSFSGGTSKSRSVQRRFQGFEMAVNATLENYQGEIHHDFSA